MNETRSSQCDRGAGARQRNLMRLPDDNDLASWFCGR
jgi:hypothetical protein